MADTALVELALAVLEKVDERNRLFWAENSRLRDLCGDFAPSLTAIDPEAETPIKALVDAVLGEHWYDYFLYEIPHLKDGGSVTEKNGTYWPIRNITDLRAYLKSASGA